MRNVPPGMNVMPSGGASWAFEVSAKVSKPVLPERPPNLRRPLIQNFPRQVYLPQARTRGHPSAEIRKEAADGGQHTAGRPYVRKDKITLLVLRVNQAVVVAVALEGRDCAKKQPF